MIAPYAYATAEKAPLAIEGAAAGLSRSLTFTLFGFFTSSRLLQLHTAPKAASARTALTTAERRRGVSDHVCMTLMPLSPL